MRALNELPRTVAAGMHTVFSDIDDTLTTDGQLVPQAYVALDTLRRAGLRVILITGRPAGWCDHIARMWPVDAVIGENGAFDWSSDVALPICDTILREVPGCAVASDQFCRLYDLAIDFCEDVPALPPDAIDRIVTIMEAAGMTAKVSSIHVNGWFGSYDKLSMAHLMMRERYGLELADERERCLFVGDSPNDAPMFAYLPHAVGVANVRDFADRMSALPAYVTPSRGGAGFAELAQVLLAARGA